MTNPNAFEKIAGMQEAELASSQPALAKTKQSLMQQVHDARNPRHRSRLWLSVAAAAAVMTGVVLGYLFLRGDSVLNTPSRWLVASSTASESMAFADGSNIRLSPGSAARVLQTAPHSVRVLVENGRADVRVTHARNTEWLLEAGPYMVRVTGTQFAISWEASTERFKLSLKRGSVLVTGPMIEEGKIVRQGERIAASVREKRIEITATGSKENGADDASGRRNAMGGDFSDAAGELTSRITEVPRKSSGKHRAASEGAAMKFPGGSQKEMSWSNLCRKGEFREVVRQAETRGVQTVIQSGTLDELMALGEATRLTRNRAISADVYLAVRKRFGNTAQAGAAAFYLGKMAFDQQHAFGTAAMWLNTYLNESPRGTFSRDALGKLMEAQHRSGETVAASRNAQKYLEQYPDGAHADIARKILGRN